MFLNRHLFRDTHVHRFTVVASGQHGWDVIEEEDSSLRALTHREDWHQVERDVQRFNLTALALKRDGWIEPEIAGVRS